MNKTISKILKDCTDQVEGGSVVDQEKFAELIVNACADAADMYSDQCCVHVGDCVGEQMGFGEIGGIAAWRCS
jgi:hypothetical protein